MTYTLIRRSKWFSGMGSSRPMFHQEAGSRFVPENNAFIGIAYSLAAMQKFRQLFEVLPPCQRGHLLGSS